MIKEGMVLLNYASKIDDSLSFNLSIFHHFSPFAITALFACQREDFKTRPERKLSFNSIDEVDYQVAHIFFAFYLNSILTFFIFVCRTPFVVDLKLGFNGIDELTILFNFFFFSKKGMAMLLILLGENPKVSSSLKKIPRKARSS